MKLLKLTLPALLTFFLINGCEQTGEVNPTAIFTVEPASGTVETVFTVDASASSDTDTPTDELEVRWDWTNDGDWDTDWSTTKTADHQYEDTGTYTIQLEVRDVDGNIGESAQNVAVALMIPPASTFVMNFEDFNDDTTEAGGGHPFKGNEVMSIDHWFWAASHVAVWNVIIAVNLIVPTAAFLASFQQTPEQQPDGSWWWTYEFWAGLQLHTARLEGRLDAEGFHWDMYISRINQYDDFHWFSGWSNHMQTEGTWTLNHAPADPEPYIGIEWDREIATDYAHIKYTNIIPGSPDNGGYIEYGLEDDPVYGAFYDLYGIAEDHLMEIEWNLDTKDGRVRDEYHWDDPNWRCWDGNFQDIVCP